MADDEKSVIKEVEIDADLETVWRALTEGEQFKQWFPLDARVRPGVGGGIWMSWGEDLSYEAPIEIWEPSRHLRTREGEKIAVDYYLESRGGKTVVRLVHSGFDADAWQDELDTLDSGWATFMAHLKHYLERHRGEERVVAHARHSVVELSREEAFDRTMKALAFKRDGDRYTMLTAAGDRFEGEVRVHRPPINFTGTVDGLGDGFVMVEMEPGRGRTRPAIWVSLYRDARAEADGLERRLRELMTATFG